MPLFHVTADYPDCGGTLIEDRDSLIDHYPRMRTDLLKAIEGFTGEQLQDPALDGWSVKDHLATLRSGTIFVQAR
jgi:hypothetical protein